MISRFTVGVVLAIQLARGASPPAPGEYDVKAAFLLNFARYIDWEPEAFKDASDPIVFCVLGPDPFGHALDDVVAGRSIEGRALTVRRISDVRLASGCRILYIGPSRPKSEMSASGAPLECGILTVGEARSAVADSTVVNFTTEDGKIHFTVNMVAAAREQLRVSSRLLGLATSVRR